MKHIKYERGMKVTRQETINYLNQYRFAKAEAIRLDEQLLRLKSERERITPQYAAAQGSSGDGNRIEKLTEKIISLENLLWDKRLACISCLETIEKVVDSVADDRQKHILRLRYIEGYSLEEIAICTNYSYRHVARLQSQATKKMSLNVL